MHRFYVDEGGITEGRARLTPEEQAWLKEKTRPLPRA